MSEKIDLIKDAIQAPPSVNINDNDVYNIGSFIGEALDDDKKINSLISMTKPEITVLVGFVGFGKTSFIASCFHILLMEGKIGDYVFYDSDTLTGFERRLYLRRISEEYDEITPQTRRTIRGEPHLLTLRFSHNKYGDKIVVISDHSGEDYDDYRNKKNNLEKDVLLSNADRILFFVDCGKLVNNGRLNMQNQYSQLIRNMYDTSSFKKDVKIQFLFNKLDLTEGKEDKYKSEKNRFLDFMTNLLYIPVGESIEVISNQVDCETVKKILFDIVDKTKSKKLCEKDITELDWVKSMIK